MSELTKDLTVVGLYIVDLFKVEAVPDVVPSQDEVYYGPQNLIPTLPAIVVDPQPKTRDYATTHQFQIVFNVHIMLMWGHVENTAQENRMETDAKAELIEDILHSDKKFGGLLYTSLVTRIDPRVTVRTSSKIKASRIQWQGESREAFS
jgi:hypothetical protein